MERSSKKTGISASFASFNTGSQPVATTGAIKIASTPLCNEGTYRFNLVFLLLLTIGNFQRNSAFSASLFATLVSAARQPDSDPTCENPTVNGAANAIDDMAAETAETTSKRFHIGLSSSE